mgnify:CR=1 FL=1
MHKNDGTRHVHAMMLIAVQTDSGSPSKQKALCSAHTAAGNSNLFQSTSSYSTNLPFGALTHTPTLE